MSDLVAEDCLNYDENCSGEVKYYTTGNSLKAWPRCLFHQEKRWERYEKSETERYAHSDVAPPGFDPTFAGERWDDDY